jgi:hypothetical protein
MSDRTTSKDVARRREKIERERDELARTVQALVDKFDVPARTRAAIGSAKTRVRDVATQRRAVIWTAAGAAVVCVIGLAWWRRRYW